MESLATASTILATLPITMNKLIQRVDELDKKANNVTPPVNDILLNDLKSLVNKYSKDIVPQEFVHFKDHNNILIQLIRKAKKYIYISTDKLGDMSVINELFKITDLEIRVLVDGTNFDEDLNLIPLYTQAVEEGLSIKYSRFRFIENFIIVDDRIVVSGSYTLSREGCTQYMIVSENNLKLASVFMEHFLELWDNEFLFDSIIFSGENLHSVNLDIDINEFW
eukprot:TRINITY_DN12835_c0_g1_i1.p1 TRINITY_DN12835_c0_g1~~TRINITY_DN12835_c0_g1_i1.p1  ORF type:complete len:223 (+),score=42.08 TRINITY_DN12835_c0_g1_i1:46-714(+)